MKKFLILASLIVILVTVKCTEETKSSLIDSISQIFTKELFAQQDDSVDHSSLRQKRGSPTANIGAYITSYWEKKKIKELKNKNKYKTRRPTKRPSYHKKHKHCYYDYYK